MAHVRRVEFKYERTVCCYIQVEDDEDIVDFLETRSDWKPSDVEGLIEHVEEEELGYEICKPNVVTVTANYRITPQLDLMEIET